MTINTTPMRAKTIVAQNMLMNERAGIEQPGFVISISKLIIDNRRKICRIQPPSRSLVADTPTLTACCREMKRETIRARRPGERKTTAMPIVKNKMMANRMTIRW